MGHIEFSPQRDEDAAKRMFEAGNVNRAMSCIDRLSNCFIGISDTV